MKQIKFETDKGEFLLVDIPNNHHFKVHYGHLVVDSTSNGLIGKMNKLNNDPRGFIEVGSLIASVKEITEKQASEIVQADEYYHGRHYYRNYVNEDGETYRSAIESLHSLLKSKGIHLFQNPIKKHHYLGEQMIAKFQFERDWNKAEEKTFYNPFIFKI